jgi:ATP-binding cassette subfamily B (MDR/TAP) protein 1
MKISVPPCSFREFFRFADRIDLLLMVVGTLFSLGNGVSLIFYAQPFGKLVDAFAPGKDSQEIVDDTLSSVKLFAINSAIVFVSSWFMSGAWSITSERQMIKARKLYFSSLIRQEVAWHDRNRPTEVCSKMYIEIAKVHRGLVNNVTSMLTKLSMGISGVVIALANGWQMALVMMAFLPFMTISGFVSGHYLKEIEKYQQKTKAKLDAEVIEVFDSIKTVRMLDGENYETERYLKRLKKTKN